MRVELKILQRRLGVTVLFVTHDQIEALSLSDRLGVMHRGRVEQVGPPRELYEHPGSPFVRDFLGQTVVLRGRVDTPDPHHLTVKMDGALTGRILAGRTAPGVPLAAGADAQLAIRPEDIAVAAADGAPPGRYTLPGIIEALLFVGDRYEVRVALGGEQRILLLLPRTREWREGQRVELGFPPDLVSVWPA